MTRMRNTLVLLALAALPVGPAAGQSVWQRVRVASANDVGQWAALALEPTTNTPYIGYLDATNQALRLAHPVGSGGNCGPGGSWLCEFPDFWKLTAGDDGVRNPQRISMAFKPGCGVHPSVAYSQDLDPRTVLAMVWGCTAPDVTAFVYVDASQEAEESALRFSDAGDALLAFRSLGSLTSTLHEARLAGGSWADVPILSGTDVGQQPAPMGLGGLSAVVYRGALGHLSFVLEVPPGFGNCGLGNGWQCSEITGLVSALDATSLAAFSSGVHVAYVKPEFPGSSLNTALYVGNNGNCGAGEWKCTTIEEIGDDVVQGVSIAVDANEVPVIAYHNKLDGNGNGVLKVARPQLRGNCGPLTLVNGLLVHSWQCTTVDDGAGANNVGRHVSVAVDPMGMASVAYYDASEGDLWLATEQQPVAAFGTGLVGLPPAPLAALLAAALWPRRRRSRNGMGC
jgi:hypothetical protein